ncbi:MAG: ABC transporter ATP-binding protein [Desulfuromonadaceae bacterium]|nr:ABC transporter ATP-binding protein [Desulfuromonadaceae bacterium]
MSCLALDIRNLEKNYGGPTVVDNLTLSIKPGEIFGLLGPNGAGKSTTINMVAGVTRIGSGTISIFGYDNRRDYRTARRLTGVMHQEIVIDNFFSIERALKIHAGYFGVVDDPAWRNLLIDRLGLRPHLGKVMFKLSGGLKRRFMIAKALVHKPRLLILDEPTAGVDVELRHTLWEFVREINTQGTTILLTTHYLEEAEQMCDRIAIMHHGKLVALEKTADLTARHGQRHLELTLKEALTVMPDTLAQFSPRLSNDGLALELTLATDSVVGEILDRVRAAGIEVVDVDTRQPHLEDIFLQLTGIGAGNGGENHGA